MTQLFRDQCRDAWADGRGWGLTRLWLRILSRKFSGSQRLKSSETMAILKGRMDLRPLRNTWLVEIRVFSDQPEEAAKLANAIARSYREWSLARSTPVDIVDTATPGLRLVRPNKPMNIAVGIIDLLRSDPVHARRTIQDSGIHSGWPGVSQALNCLNFKSCRAAMCGRTITGRKMKTGVSDDHSRARPLAALHSRLRHRRMRTTRLTYEQGPQS